MTPTNSQLLLATIISFICFITDIKYAKIFNKVTFPAMLLGLITAYSLFGVIGIKNSLYGLITGIIIYFPLALFGLVGMGDVKLLGAIGSICGFYFIIKIFLLSSAIGFFHAIIIQIMNYGIKGIKLLLISLKEKTFLKKTLTTENISLSKTGKYKFLIGIDIFIATIILSYLYAFTDISKT